MENITKYTEEGFEVSVIQKVDGGYICQPVYETYSNDPSDYSEGTPYFETRNLYDEPPVQKYEKRIAELEKTINELQDKAATERRIFLEEEKSRVLLKAKLEKFKQLRLLEDYIDGKITHYVEEAYEGPRIIPFKEATCSGDDTRRDLKLLTLFGDSKGNLNWKLNYYRDGSGNSTIVHLATSEEEAIKLCKEVCEKRIFETEKYPRESIIVEAEKYGVIVPTEYREKAMKAKKDSLKSELEKTLKRIEEIKKEIG
jgi:uncharacterized coiled-coil protein SlyX